MWLGPAYLLSDFRVTEVFVCVCWGVHVHPFSSSFAMVA